MVRCELRHRVPIVIANPALFGTNYGSNNNTCRSSGHFEYGNDVMSNLECQLNDMIHTPTLEALNLLVKSYHREVHTGSIVELK